MISREQIAHDLTMVYLNNKYGIDVTGDFNMYSNSSDDTVNSSSGYGSVITNHFPNVKQPKYKKIGTGEKGFLGIEKKKKVPSGYLVDDIFNSMIDDYGLAYTHFLELLKSK
ncbi:hypothetical protein [Lacrimispora sp.]|uniref:hypothetical protein n=1 Tax=Lacrimispora sp. TaxID=2719234 RepID=UPI00399636D4